MALLRSKSAINCIASLGLWFGFGSTTCAEHAEARTHRWVPENRELPRFNRHELIHLGAVLLHSGSITRPH